MPNTHLFRVLRESRVPSLVPVRTCDLQASAHLVRYGFPIPQAGFSIPIGASALFTTSDALERALRDLDVTVNEMLKATSGVLGSVINSRDRFAARTIQHLIQQVSCATSSLTSEQADRRIDSLGLPVSHPLMEAAGTYLRTLTELMDDLAMGRVGRSLLADRAAARTLRAHSDLEFPLPTEQTLIAVVADPEVHARVKVGALMGSRPTIAAGESWALLPAGVTTQKGVFEIRHHETTRRYGFSMERGAITLTARESFAPSIQPMPLLQRETGMAGM